MLSWRTRWKLIEYVRNSIWIVPAIFTALAIAMGLILPGIDERTSDVIGVSFGASSAQSILGTLAGGMITFTGFVFSILLLAVQFGSSQFSPRMLRRFLRDPTTKIALGMFMATFIYALLVLRKIQPATNQDFIPDFSVQVALWLLLFSMVLFLRLISRTTQGLRVASVLRDLGRDGAEVIDRVYPQEVGEGGAPERAPGRSGPAERTPRRSRWSTTTTSPGSCRASTRRASSRSRGRPTPWLSSSRRSATSSLRGCPCSAFTATPVRSGTEAQGLGRGRGRAHDQAGPGVHLPAARRYLREGAVTRRQ